jgi:hypothetical protein
MSLLTPIPQQTRQEPKLLVPLLPPQLVPSNSPGTQKCRGWTCVKYVSLFKMLYSNFVGHSMTTNSTVFSKDHPSVDLPPSFLRISKSSTSCTLYWQVKVGFCSQRDVAGSLRIGYPVKAYAMPAS